MRLRYAAILRYSVIFIGWVSIIVVAAAVICFLWWWFTLPSDFRK